MIKSINLSINFQYSEYLAKNKGKYLQVIWMWNFVCDPFTGMNLHKLTGIPMRCRESQGPVSKILKCTLPFLSVKGK